MRTAWYYFPKRKGLATGIIVCGFGISASILNIFIQYQINPDGIKPDSNGFYNSEISNRVPQYLLQALILFSIMSVISVLLVIPYEDQEVDKSIQGELLDDSSKSFNRKKYIQAVSSSRFFSLCGITFCSSCKQI